MDSQYKIKMVNTTSNLVMYVVYENPADYPDKWVVRDWKITTGVQAPEFEPRAVVESLKEARATIPEGAVNLGRRLLDDLCIYEVWV